jgi:hypothetical protein
MTGRKGEPASTPLEPELAIIVDALARIAVERILQRQREPNSGTQGEPPETCSSN